VYVKHDIFPPFFLHCLLPVLSPREYVTYVDTYVFLRLALHGVIEYVVRVSSVQFHSIGEKYTELIREANRGCVLVALLFFFTLQEQTFRTT
jgi:hypothetical protein